MSIVDNLLGLVKIWHPELSVLIDLAIKYEPQIEKLGPVIVAAAEEGPGAFAAAKEKAPDLAKAIENFVHAMPGTAVSHAAAAISLNTAKENITRQIFGAAKMTPDEEMAWMDRASPISQDSRSGSG